MTDTTNDATPTSGGGSAGGGIRPVRKMRGSAPISAELFTSTTNPLVIAFQTSAMFAGVTDPDLTLTVLQQRWSTSRRGAADARRTLIDLGYWVEVLARQSDGRFRTETRTWEVRLTEDDLADLAAQYALSSVLECGGRSYVVTADGLTPHDKKTPRRHRPTTSGNPVRPAETSNPAVTVLPPVVTRSDQGIVDNSVTVLPPVVTRPDQQKQEESAGHTELPPVVVPHASISFRDGYECMHDEFWAEIGRLVATPIDPGGRKSVHDQLAVAFQAGWLPGRLARWLGEQVAAARRLSNPAGFVVARLREIPAPADVPASPHELAAERRRAAELRAREQANCSMCDERGYIGQQLCDHDPTSVDRAARGAAAVRAALQAKRDNPGSDRPAATLEPQRRAGGLR